MREQTTCAGFRSRQCFLFVGQKFDQNLFETFTTDRINRNSKRFSDDCIRPLQTRLISDDAKIDISRARTITELDSRNRQDLVADFLFHQRFTDSGNPIEVAIQRAGKGNDRAQDGQYAGAKHRLQLALRPRQNKNVRRREPWIDIRAQIQTRSAPVLVREDLRAGWNIGLTRDACCPFDFANRQPLFERLQKLPVLAQLQPEQIGHDFARNIVAGRSEHAGYEQDLAVRKQIAQRMADDLAIRNSALFLDPQTERKNLTGDEIEMRIDNIAEQKLGAGVEDDAAHLG